jgi:NADPH-dependent F420 reductase
MKITILGAGNVGGTLGRRWAAGGHEIIFGSRNPESDKIKQLLSQIGNGTKAVSIGEAVNGSDVVLLATPWSAAEETLDQAGNLTGKTLIDATNPIAEGLSGLTLGTTTSAGEMVAQWSPGARVVKAFNTTGSGNMANPRYGRDKIAMPICSDNQEAKDVVKQLAEELGFDVYDAGPLASARYLEPMAMLWITLAYKQGLGPDMAFKIIKRRVEDAGVAE